ncbi:restriction endonuclease subunit S [Staphylococcus sp. SS60]|nr:restriction endonuclease subunit S [Staphylococcus singaporensis]
MSNTQKKNVPELRFPEFEGEWEEKKIGDIIKVNSGKDYKHLDNGDIPVYGTGGYMTSVSEPLSELDAVGIGRKGTINKPYLLEAPFWTVDTLFYCTPKKEADILFILSLFRKINWKVYDESTGVPSLSKQTINKINRFVPTNKEQQKIGGFFSKLDRQIELEEQKLELLQQQKKGYMQKIFSQELRFKDENGNDYPEWENSKIENYLKERNERSDKGEMLSVTINSGIIKFSELDRKDNSSKDKSNYKVVKKNDIAYNSMRMWQGASGKSNYNGIVSPAYTVLYPTQNTSSLFIGYKFKTHRMIYTFKINSQGLTSDTWNLKYKQLKNIKIDIPALEEQEKIGDFFKKMDLFISKQKMKIEMLEQEKQSLLQKMFV